MSRTWSWPSRALTPNCSTVVNDLATDAELQVKVLPAVSDLLDGVSFRQMRDIETADLLGRRPVETDLESIAGYLTDRNGARHRRGRIDRL